MTLFTPPIYDRVVTRDFHYRSSLYVGGQHAACDYAPQNRPATGEPIRAVANGVTAGVGWDFYSGFFVALDHAGGWRSTYRHLYGQTPVVVGQSVTQNQIIGNVGNTGWSLGAHLHFDLWNAARQDTTAFAKHGIWAHDPELYLGQEDDMATLEERVAMHEQYHNETIDLNIRQLNDRVKNLEDAVAALKAGPAGGGIKRGDTIKIKLL